MTVNPIVNTERRRTVMYVDDIYTGPNGVGQYVPRIDDMIYSWTEGTLRCVAVDPVTHLSTLVPYNLFAMYGGQTVQDVLLGVGKGAVTEAHRVYINTSVVPHVMAFDSRLRLYGSGAAYVKVFRGHDTGNSGHVVSAMYNTSNVVISENIPLELALFNNVTNFTVKVPTLAWCQETIPNNEALTVVVYSASGQVLGSTSVVAKISNFVRTVDQSKKYITNIDLISPYVSTTDSRKLEYPINMLIQSGSLIGRVHYNDGSAPVNLPIDDTKFSLYGINSFISSKVGSTVDLVLSYKLSADEYSYITNAPTPERTITKTYRLVTTEAVNRYSVKLYAIPQWIGGSTNRWSLSYYLYDLDRSVIMEVTPFIENMVSSTPFNGNLYGTTQSLTVSLNLENLGSSYMWYRHVETFDITLHSAGGVMSPQSFWAIAYTNTMSYGHKLFAHCTAIVGGTANYKVNIANGCTTTTEWLAKHYWPLEPLKYIVSEATAPNPTHIRLKVGTGFTRTIPLADVLNDINNVIASISGGTTVRLEFIRVTSTQEQELAMGSLNALLG